LAQDISVTHVAQRRTMSSYFSKGFSLIELMIALAVAAIIAAIAVPAYQDHMLRARIPEATSTLSALAMRLEQHYQDHHKYGTTEDGCAVAMPANQFFTFQCAAQNGGQSFLLTATGRGGGQIAEFTFTLDQNGSATTTRLPETWGKTPATCWVTKRDAQC
jgi:type IV pilus assembly protein PilE